MNFEMYSTEGNSLVFRIAEAARRLLKVDGATSHDVLGFIENNLQRLSVAYPEATDSVVREKVFLYVDR